MWEWRVFYNVSHIASATADTTASAAVRPASQWDDTALLPDVWLLLDDGKPPMWTSKERTDLYLACTPRVGVKIRSGKTLELKLRSERSKKSGTERWHKVGRPIEGV